MEEKTKNYDQFFENKDDKEPEEELTFNQKTWESLTEHIENLRNIMTEMTTEDLISYLKNHVAEGSLKLKDIKEIKACANSLSNFLK